MLKYNKYNLIKKHMIFLNNLKNSFSFFLFSSLVENWPTWLQESNSSIEQTRNLESQNLTPEQQEISDKIDSLQKKYETLITSEKITKAVADRLLAWLTSDPEIQNDPEAKPTIDMFNRYRTMFENASSEWTEVKLQLAELKSLLSRASNALEYAAWVEFDSSTWEIKEMSLEKEKLKTITNKEFLVLPKEERLQYITKDNIDAEYVSNWSVNELEFNFTFDWVLNREFYMYTTAWQVLPKEVWFVEDWWVIYERKWLNWEFFNESWTRLTIHQDTKLSIWELRTQENIDSINQDIQSKVNLFLENNLSPEKNNDYYRNIITEAYSNWVEPNLILSIVGNEEKGWNDISYILTRILVAIWNLWLANKENFDNSDLLEIFYLVSPENFKEIWLNHWIPEEEINQTQVWRSPDSIVDIEKYWESLNWFLDFLSVAEWTRWNYNAMFWSPWQSRVDLTTMTVREVIAFQWRYKRWDNPLWRRLPSAAAWKYQFMDYTLTDMANRWQINLDERFTPEFQDRIATIKLRDRWLDNFIATWNISRFQRNLSMEWASLPKDSSWLSYYHWDNAWNRSHVTHSDMQGILSWLHSTLS